MKKLLSLIFAAAFTLTLCACDKADNGSGSEAFGSSLISGESTADTSTEQTAPVGGDNTQNVPLGGKRLTLLCDGSILRGGCGTEDGYYSIQSIVAGSGLDCITYIDYASKQEVFLCSDSSCKHDTKHCTSVVPHIWGMVGELFFYKEHLYYLVTAYDGEGQISAGGSFSPEDDNGDLSDEKIPRLYRMNPDGTNRELVYTFGKNEVVEGSAVGDGDCIWFITKEPTVERDEETGAVRCGSKNRAMVRLDLNERNIVEQIPVYSSDNIRKSFIGVYGSRIIFGGTAYPDGKSAMDHMDILAPSPIIGDMSGWDEYLAFKSKCEYAFFALNVTDKTMTEIYRTGFDDISRDFTQVGDRLYIPSGGELSSAFSLDLNTGAVGEFPVPEGYKLDGFVGERPLYITTDGEYKRCFADPETGEMKSWMLEYGIEDIIAVNGDSALVTYKTVGEVQPDGSILNPHYLYALITLDDLYNGRDNFKPIDMLERS